MVAGEWERSLEGRYGVASEAGELRCTGALC